MLSNAPVKTEFKKIEELATAIRREGPGPQQLRRHAAIGRLASTAMERDGLSAAEFKEPTGWQRANILKPVWFSEWADPKTLARLVAHRDRTGQCPFTWRVAILLTLQDSQKRGRLIDQAIKQGLTARKLEQLINPVHERPRLKDLREAKKPEKLLKLFGGCIRGFSIRLNARRPRSGSTRSLVPKLAMAWRWMRSCVRSSSAGTLPARQGQ